MAAGDEVSAHGLGDRSALVRAERDPHLSTLTFALP